MEIPREVLKNIRSIQIRTGRIVTELFAGSYHSAFKGRGVEFEDVREYQPGDEVQSIDWNVTARMDYPYIKNFREERELTVMLVVDLSASARFGTGRKEKRELIAEISALLALAAQRSGDRVGLLLFTDRVESYLAPKKGVGHIQRLIRELLLFEPKGEGTDIGGALNHLSRIHRRRGICFLLSDFLAPDATRELTLAAKRYDLVSLCITDPKEIDFPDMGLVALRDLESGLSRLVDSSPIEVRERLRRQTEERIEGLRGLMERVRGSFVDLRTDADYLAPLRGCFARRERR